MNAHMQCTAQKDQLVMQHNVFMQRFISPQQTYFDSSCDSHMAEDSSSCPAAAVADSSGFLSNMQAVYFAKIGVPHT